MTKEQQRMAVGKEVHKAVKNGILIKPERCSQCGKKVIEARQLHAHHADYRKPLNVEWLCRTCHAKRHALLRWFALGFQFFEWCKRRGINPKDGDMPGIHKRTGRPMKRSILELWLGGRRE